MTSGTTMPNTRETAAFFRTLFVALALSAPFSGALAGVRGVSVSADTLVLDADFSGFSPSFLQDARSPDVLIAAETPERILIRSGSPELSISELSRESLPFRERVRIVRDVAKTPDEMITVPSDAAGRQVPFVSAGTLGQVHGDWLIEVRVHPFAVTRNQVPERAVSLRLQVAGSRICVVTGEAEKNALLQAVQSTRLNKNTLAARSVEPAGVSDHPRLKIRVQKDGLYIIPQASVRASGWDLSGLDPRLLRMRGRDGEIPIRVTGEEDGSFDMTDAVEFWGEQIWDRSIPGQKRLYPYSDFNVYWLEVGTRPGIRMAQEEGLVSDTPASQMVTARSYMQLQHEEKDVEFDRFIDMDIISDADYWIYRRQSGGEKTQIQFKLENPDNFSTQMAGIRIALRGQSNSNKNQPVDVFINNKLAVSGIWRGSGSVILESRDISPTVLSANNELTVVNRSDEKELAPLFLDWFEITCPKLYKADENHIRFSAPPGSAGETCRFQIEGFTDRNIDVYKIGASRILGVQWFTVMDTLGQVSQTMRFEDGVVDESAEYLALSPVRKMLPDSVEMVRNMSLTRTGRGADYIAIVSSSDSLSGDALQPLIQLRTEQGLQCVVIQLDSIYNEFSSGIPDPSAIKAFLQHAGRNWNPPPRWVVLVGDGSYNNRHPVEKGNVIPVKMVQTLKYGATVSDYWYTVSDDGTPLDVSIGRLPAGTRAELTAIVNKTIDYEKSVPGLWKNRYLMIAAGYRNDGLFGGQTETLIRNAIPDRWSPDRLFLTGSPGDPDFGGTEELMDILNDGVGWVNFRGHGGGGIWYDQGLLTLENIQEIENKGKLPFVTSMTCYTGDFSSTRDGLGEALLTLEGNGAVAFWGTAGAGWTYADYYMLTDFVELSSANPQLSLGELIHRAKIEYYQANPGDLGFSEIYQYNLLGDPALKWTFPAVDAELSMTSLSVPAADSIRISGKSAAESNQVRLEWYGSNRAAASSWTYGNLPADWNASVALPADFRESRAGVRAYVWNEMNGTQAGGSIAFSIGQSRFDSLKTMPEKPTSRDSLLFAARAEDAAGIKKIWCQVISPRPETIDAMPMAGTGLYITSRWYGKSQSGSLLAYCFVSENGKGIVTRSDTVRMTIPTPPDLAVMSIRLSGTDQVFLESEIMNYGGEDVVKTSVHFECPYTGFSQYAEVEVPGNTQITARVPFPSFSGQATFLVKVNPDSSQWESSYRNNLVGDRFTLDRFDVTPASGSMSHGRFGPVGLTGQLECYVPAGALSKASVLLFERLADVSSETPVPPGTAVYRLTFPGLPGSFAAAKDMLLLFRRSQAEQDAMPYRFDDSIHKWLVCAHTANDSIITVQTRRMGLFCLLDADDGKPPVLELQANGQAFSSGSYVSSRPRFSVLIQDSSGVDIRPDRIHMMLDGVEQDPSLFSLPDSTLNPAMVTVVFRPILTAGNHTLKIAASDVHGNSGQTETVSFNVSDAFEIRYLGNHPNPFRRETVFVYVLTDGADRVHLRIYTVSGRRIRTFEEPDMTAADYHEIIWDGKDEWGEDTANGAYFFRLTAEKQGIHKEITGKIARLR